MLANARVYFTVKADTEEQAKNKARDFMDYHYIGLPVYTNVKSLNICMYFSENHTSEVVNYKEVED